MMLSDGLTWNDPAMTPLSLNSEPPDSFILISADEMLGFREAEAELSLPCRNSMGI